MPAPPRTQAPPPRIRIELAGPMIDCGRYPVKRTRRRHRRGLGRHLPRRPRRPARRRPLPAPGETAVARGAARARSTPTHNGDRWAGAFAVDALGRWAVDDRGVGRRLRHLARRARAQGRRRPDRPERRARRRASSLLRDAAAARPTAADRSTARGGRGGARERRARRPGARRRARRARRAGRAALARSRTMPSAVRRSTSTACARRFGSWYELFPRSFGGFKGVRGAAPAARRARLRRPLPAADPPDRRDEPQGPQQHARRRPRRPRQPVGDRPHEHGGHDAIHPDLGTIEDFDALVAGGARSTASTSRSTSRSSARRPPVAHRAPGVVQPPPRRHAQVRREPAQEVPGHLQRQLGHARTGAASGRRCYDVVRHWVDHGVRVFRVDNPHTKPLAVLGVADRPRSARTHPDVIFLAEAFTRRGDDAHARQARLQPVLHVLHVEELALGAHGVRRRARAHRGGASTSGRTSSSTRRTSSPSTSSTAARRRSPRGSSSPRRSARPTASTPASSTSRTCRRARARGVPRLREVRDQAAPRSTARCCRSSQRLNQIRREQPGAAAPREPAVPRDGERRAHRLRQARGPTTS